MADYLHVLKSVIDDGNDGNTENQSEAKEGAIIGYVIALSASVAHNTKKSEVDGIMTFYEHLQEKVSTFNKDELTTLTAQCFCFGLASLTVASYHTNLVDGDKVIEIQQILRKQVKMTPQVFELRLDFIRYITA